MIFAVRIEVEVRLRSHVRGVRPVEAGGDEEGFAGVLFKQADRGVGADAVGLLGVGAVGGEPAQGGAEAAPGLDAEDLRLVVLVAPTRVDHLEP